MLKYNRVPVPTKLLVNPTGKAAADEPQKVEPQLYRMNRKHRRKLKADQRKGLHANAVGVPLAKATPLAVDPVTGKVRTKGAVQADQLRRQIEAAQKAEAAAQAGVPADIVDPVER